MKYPKRYALLCLLLLLTTATRSEESTSPETKKWLEAQAASQARVAVQFSELINNPNSGFNEHCDDEIAIAEKNKDPVLNDPTWAEKIGQRVIEKFYKRGTLKGLLAVSDDELMAKIKSQRALKQEETGGVNTAPEALEFINGQTVTFSSKDHPKADGIIINLRFPASWVAKEGNHPHTVQKFIRPGSMDSAVLTLRTLVHPQGKKPTEKDIADALTPEAMKQGLPAGATYISCRPTKIDGLPAVISEYSLQNESAGISISMQMVDFTIIHEFTMIHFVGSVGGPTNQAADLPQRMAELMPLYVLMANSIVVENKWK